MTFIAFSLLSIGLVGQNNNASQFSYSLSYIPPSLRTSDGETSFLPKNINLEANVQYKPFDRFSFSSGIAYIRYCDLQDLAPTSVTIEQDVSYMISSSAIRIPLQFNYHFIKAPQKIDSYLKAVYTNGFSFSQVHEYENDVETDNYSQNNYHPSAGLGIGGIFLKNKPVGIILEGTIEKYLRWDTFNMATFYSIKIGVVI
jgi:hypothetical protein